MKWEKQTSISSSGKVVIAHTYFECPFPSGGLELLFDKEKTFALELDNEKVKNLQDLIQYMRDNLLKEKPELFVSGDSLYDIFPQ